MAKIRIGDAVYRADVRHSGEMLALTFKSANIEEVASMLWEDRAPQITVYRPDGAVDAIYRNHALLCVKAEIVGGVGQVRAEMATDEIPASKADGMQEEINLLKEENAMLTACVLEMSEIVYA